MKVKILRYLKHVFFTVIVLAAIAVFVGLQIGAAVNYGEHPQRLNLDKEGPYIFYKNDSTLNVNYIKGNKDDGFYLQQQDYPASSKIKAKTFFGLDSTYFYYTIDTVFGQPASVYQDDNPILAISDIEGGYKTFRDFLINNKVIDADLNWSFGKGHLVLVGDFVDRGYSVTQVLWFIYKLENEAEKQGGKVHFILGNHELKNMQGKYEAASPRYYAAAAILGKLHHQLYDSNSFIGRWMASKNSIEKINGNIFVHGGIHPEVADLDLNLEEINQIVKKQYYQTYFPKTEKSAEQLLTSTKKGISWYRGYYKEDLKQVQIDYILQKFDAKSIVVGHTLQSEVSTSFEGKIIGIDIKHPKDYRNTWPNTDSQGLLIKDDQYYRTLLDGSKELL
ncbi:MAG: hypothetical protein CMO01_26815 [Thalassobius sp.]|nr:hypothetical protein [Thalassovita sp.]